MQQKKSFMNPVCFFHAMLWCSHFVLTISSETRPYPNHGMFLFLPGSGMWPEIALTRARRVSEKCVRNLRFFSLENFPHTGTAPRTSKKNGGLNGKGGGGISPQVFLGWIKFEWCQGDHEVEKVMPCFLSGYFCLPSMFLLFFFQISRVFSSFSWDLPRTKLKGLIKDVPMRLLEISGDVLDKLFWESWSEVADDYSMCWIRALWKPMIMIMIEISVPCLGWIYDGFLPFTTYHPLQTSSNLLGIVQVSTFKDGFWSGGEAYPIHWQV